MFWVEGSDEPVLTGQSVMDTGSLRFRWSRVEQLPYKAEMHLVRMCSMVHQWTWRIFADTCKSKYADVVFDHCVNEPGVPAGDVAICQWSIYHCSVDNTELCLASLPASLGQQSNYSVLLVFRAELLFIRPPTVV